MVPPCLGNVGDAIYVGVKDARRHVMQQGFPDVDQAGIDQGDIVLS
jgi:hypothetical protein